MARPGARYSAMARAVQRMHLPAWEWWRMLSLDERRHLVTASLAHPLRTVRHLLMPRRPAQEVGPHRGVDAGRQV